MLYDSKNWIFDLDTVLQTLPELDELAGKIVLITGVGGLVCSAVTDLLIRYNETHKSPIIVYAAARSEEKILERFGTYAERDWFRFIPYDAGAESDHFPPKISYIIHGASNASPDRIVKEPVETMVSNFTGLRNLLEYSRTHNCKMLLYISSSEVYGKKENTDPYREDEYGYIDLLNPRNSYSVGKRAAETLCVSYAAEYGTQSVIVRPGHIYGPTAGAMDVRVSSSWAYDAASGRDIVMKSDGAQLRSYCYCLDCASAILKVMLRGESGLAYNISNPDSIISIQKMAEILADVGNVQLRMDLPTETERKAFNPMSNSSLESGSLQGLGWKGCFNAETGFAHTIQILRESGLVRNYNTGD